MVIARRKKPSSPANSTPPEAARIGGTCFTPWTLNIVPTLERTLEIMANAMKLERLGRFVVKRDISLGLVVCTFLISTSPLFR